MPAPMASVFALVKGFAAPVVASRSTGTHAARAAATASAAALYSAASTPGVTPATESTLFAGMSITGTAVADEKTCVFRSAKVRTTPRAAGVAEKSPDAIALSTGAAEAASTAWRSIPFRSSGVLWFTRSNVTASFPLPAVGRAVASKDSAPSAARCALCPALAATTASGLATLACNCTSGVSSRHSPSFKRSSSYQNDTSKCVSSSANRSLVLSVAIFQFCCCCEKQIFPEICLLRHHQ
mmetsp:Transcript_43370/g.133984  ORF Transcript_43370/g.133984 Transcript_43370/m.133984 type:complete len:240 (-) Transcript_43370:21-740(-)